MIRDLLCLLCCPACRRDLTLTGDAQTGESPIEGDRPNVNIVQADVVNLPFRENVFDIVFSIGVLHHTPDTRRAFQGLPRLLSDGGLIAVWLYHHTDPVYRAACDFWRSIFSRLPRWSAYAWCWLPVVALSPVHRGRDFGSVEYVTAVALPLHQAAAA